VSINSFYKEKFNENGFIFQTCQNKVDKTHEFCFDLV